MPLNMIAWEGYEQIVRSMGVTRVDVTFDDPCPDGATVLEKFLGNTKYDLVTLDREHLSRVSSMLKPLNELGGGGLEAKEVLATALPRLAAREYYGDGRRFLMLPVRFGMNGVVYSQEAKQWLKENGCLRWNPASVTEVVDLVSLIEAVKDGTPRKPRVFRWAFDAPVRLMLRRNLRVWRGRDRELEFEKIWTMVEEMESIASLTEIIDKLRSEGSVVVIGPGDNVCGPARREREDVEWTVAQGAGLLWLEGIAVTDRVSRANALLAREVLVKIKEQLVSKGFESCCDAVGDRNYWGMPVLGWRRRGDSQHLREVHSGHVREYMRLLGYEERVEGFWRLPPEAALGQFLDGAGLNGIGIALRGFPSPWDRRAFVDSLAERLPPDEATAKRILEVQSERLGDIQEEPGVREGLRVWAEALWAEATEGGAGAQVVQNEVFLRQRYRWTVLYESGGKATGVGDGEANWIGKTVNWVRAHEKWRRGRGRGSFRERVKAWLGLAEAQKELILEESPLGLGREELDEFLSEFRCLGREFGDRREDLMTVVRRAETESLVRGSIERGGEAHLAVVSVGVLLKRVHGVDVLAHPNCPECMDKKEIVTGLFASWGVTAGPPDREAARDERAVREP